MRSCNRNSLGVVLMMAWSLAWAASVHAQQHKGVMPETAIKGLSVAERVAERAQLHQRLTAELPPGAQGKRINADLTANEHLELRSVTPVAGEPLRTGTVKTLAVEFEVTQIVPNNSPDVAGGTLQRMDDGGFTWAVAVGSEDAKAVRVHFKDFWLPANVEMYILNSAGEAYGPYTGLGRHDNGAFWSDSVRSDSALIMIRQIGPQRRGQRSDIRFTIDRVAHVGNGKPAANPQDHNWNHNNERCGFGGNPPCVEDANCGSVAPADQSAIAKMEWIAGCCIYTCTGGLIADTDNSSQRNLFLTANHCLNKNNHASNLETFFEYTTSSCEGNCPGNVAPHTSGAVVLSTSRDGDYTLLELNQNPPSGSTYLGWNSAPIANSNGANLYRVSNPNYGPQVYSEHSVDTGTGTCNGLPRGEFIYSFDEFGATDGGSSGAPVVNGSGQIVGQLFGSCGFNLNDPCDAAANATVDGALAFYFSDIEDVLDPSTGGCTSNAECDDGDACNGAETCSGGSCQSGSGPGCQNGDGCCPSGCNSGNDNDCQSCGANQSPCSSNSDCCSNKCKNGSCKGN